MFGRQISQRWWCFNIPTNLNRHCRPSKETQCFAPCICHVDRFTSWFTTWSDERFRKREMLLISQGSGGSHGGGLKERGWWRGGWGGAEAKMNWMMDKHEERKHTLFLTADERKPKICWNSPDTNTSLSSAQLGLHFIPIPPLLTLDPSPPLRSPPTPLFICPRAPHLYIFV